jgi:hypothetical protein
MNIPDFQSIINSNPYINDRTETKVDPHSFNSLISNARALNQSQNIKLGTATENLFRDTVSKHGGGFEPIELGIVEGQSQKDQCFKNDTKKTVAYFEQKNNLNLDTEKRPATISKVKKVSEELRQKFPDHTVVGGVFAARYLSSSEPLAASIIKTYAGVQVYGVNEFLGVFNIAPFSSYDDYVKVILKCCDAKFGPITGN